MSCGQRSVCLGMCVQQLLLTMIKSYPGKGQDKVIHGEFGAKILLAVEPQAHEDQGDDGTHDHGDLHGLGITCVRHGCQRPQTQPMLSSLTGSRVETEEQSNAGIQNGTLFWASTVQCGPTRKKGQRKREKERERVDGYGAM